MNELKIAPLRQRQLAKNRMPRQRTGKSLEPAKGGDEPLNFFRFILRLLRNNSPGCPHASGNFSLFKKAFLYQRPDRAKQKRGPANLPVHRPFHADRQMLADLGQVPIAGFRVACGMEPLNFSDRLVKALERKLAARHYKTPAIPVSIGAEM